MVAICLLTTGLELIGTAEAQADTMLFELPTTTNAVPVPVFNQQVNQGWLTGVDMTVRLSSTSIVSTVNSHSHNISPGIHFGGTTGVAGGHGHGVVIPIFSGNGLSIQPVTNTGVNATGSHSHSVGAFASSTNSAGGHHHVTSEKSRIHSFSGAQLAPFLGPSTFSLTGNLSVTSVQGNHTHAYTPSILSTGSHSHTFTDRWSTQTTFTFDPNDAPTANANGDYTIDFGDMLALQGGASTDPDFAFGDIIDLYEWDLDNNGAPDHTTNVPSLNLDVSQYSPYFNTAGTHPVGLRVRDSLGLVSGGFDQANVILGAPDEPFVDQSQSSSSIAASFSGGSLPLGQSFTSDVTGLLAGINVASNGQTAGGTVTMEIREGNGAGGNLLGTQEFTFGTNAFDADFNQWLLPFDITDLDIEVEGGELYTFLFSETAGDIAADGLLAEASDVYAGGQFYQSGAGVPSSDLAFQTLIDIVPPLPGDGNRDGWVNGLDYLLWAGQFGTHPGPDGDISDGDYNDDGWVNGLDYLLWAGNFGNHVSTSVPEPGTLVLMVIGVAACAIARRRR